MAWVSFDKGRNSWRVQWKAAYEGKKRYPFCLWARCNSLGGNKERAERVARRLKEAIDVAVDRGAKPVFQATLDRLIIEEWSTIPEEDSCCYFARHLNLSSIVVFLLL